MIFLVNFVGFLIQMIVCPLVMIPWLLIRLLLTKMPETTEAAVEFEQEYREKTFTGSLAAA